MVDTWKQGRVFMHHVDKHGHGYVAEHTCWNTDLFIASQRDAATKAGGSVAVVTEAEYLESKRRI